MAQLHDKKFGIFYCAEEPICAQSPVLFGALAKASGGALTVAYSGAVSATAPSYQAPCLAAQQAGVDFLDIAAIASTTAKIIDACAQQGFKPTILGTPSSLTISDPNADGMWLISPSLSTEDTTTVAGQQYQQIMTKYDPSILSGGPNLALTNAWSGLLVFQAVADQAKLTPASTPADVKDGLYNLPKGDTFDGETPPLTYVKGQATHVNCWFVVQQKNGKLVMPQGSAAECATPQQAAELAPLYAQASSLSS
jgi:branched-chain amino acid transport system substrate-binding protein